ncbi:MAG: response regulator [Alkaliphilus sp.]|nr:response regulator [Alkaliphilus sp.]
MIKVMIVDDMPIFLEYLRTAIDWEVYGFELCCEARNGQEAYEKALLYKPDIVLSDIMMPYLDGLTLAENLRQLNPEIAVVLITGNSEFEYARKALRLGVVDYIVKPFEKEELILTLLNLQDNINKVLESRTWKEDELYLKREQLLRHLIYAKSIDLKMSESLTQLGLHLTNENSFFAISIEIESNFENIHLSEKAMNWKSVIGNIYDNYMESDIPKYFFTDYEGHVVFINRINEDKELSLEDEDLEHFIQFIKQKLQLDVTIGIGGIYTGLPGIRTSYLESINALSHRFKRGGNKAIKYDMITLEEKTYGFYSAEINEIILKNLHHQNAEKTLAVIDSVFQEADLKGFSSEYRKMINMGLISLLLSYIVKARKNISDVLPQTFRPSSVIYTGTDEEQRIFIKDAYRIVFDYLASHLDTKSGQIAWDAKKFIDSNYNNPEFGMNDLSKKLLINQTYLRRMFKNEMGMTISEYLTKVRMEHAKEMILEGFYKLSAISELVGYRDAGYFSKCFKLYYGVSPSEYQ